MLIVRYKKMRQETYLQAYKEATGETTCLWGILDNKMSFLVIDATNGLHDTIRFRLQAGENGNQGILTTEDGDRCLDRTGTVVYISNTGLAQESFVVSEEELNSFLMNERLSLDLNGFRSYLEANSG